MFQSPQSLEELCLDAIADNIDLYVKPISGSFVCYTSLESGLDPEHTKYVFRDSDIFLIQQISEKLLLKLLEKELLCDSIFHIFTEENTKLGTVKIADCRLSEFGLKVLKQHKITHLECVDLTSSIDICGVIDCLNDWSQTNLITANFKNFISTGENCAKMCKVTNLKNLRSLNLAYTKLDQDGFSLICSELSQLEKLDISGTNIKNLESLLSLSNHLKSIGLADLPCHYNMVSILNQLPNIQHLDMSIVNLKFDEIKISPGQCQVTKLLNQTDAVPHLKSLEISGWKHNVYGAALYDFILAHPKLEYLGIVLCDLMFEPTFKDLNYSNYPTHLIIGGLGNKDQIKVALQKYKDRATYVRKALYHLFQMTNGVFPEPCPNMFDLVLPVMAAHQSKFEVQMAATACLYNLTKADLSKHIHPNLLSRGINLTLDAMSNFPREYQLQKNSLLTLCNDRILQEVAFDKFRCAKLVLDALCAFCDNNMSRMAVAICSILAAKISTAETSKLGARTSYMRKLLDMVENRVDNVVTDITLKFTLSALWNLTDESPATCYVFLEQKGALLFLKVLRKFKDDSTIETKVLGLLNNIAEVATLRVNLMLEDLMVELYSLLKSENIDVSYFAAGIVAHLASDGKKLWLVQSLSREEMLNELEEAVMHWQVPQSEMVAYRSFKPFFPLLDVELDYRVQLWALWAIHHVCTKSPKRYCAMLKEEHGDELLRKLMQNINTHERIRETSSQILEALEQNYKQILF